MVEREPPTDHPASWTGTGFARMLEGGWVEFHVNNVPFSTEYDVIIRYEPQVSRMDSQIEGWWWGLLASEAFWHSSFSACSTRSPGRR